MRFQSYLLVLAVFIFVGCMRTSEQSETEVPMSTNSPVIYPTSISSPHRVPLLRIAIFGEATTTNVWALFDEEGASYWNYATQASYWPQLYHLVPPTMDFVPAVAKGIPSPVVCDPDQCTATVILQPNLTWTNDSLLTAEDVAFTINTAIQFRLGLNWQKAYNPQLLERAEAVNDTTIKFYFKQFPSVTNWQYGVLQGPIVNQAYWKPRIANAVDLLPDEKLFATIQELEQEFADLQAHINSLNISLNSMAPASDSYQATSRQAKRFQDELNSISNKIDKNRTEYDTKLSNGREALFTLANAAEPTLGAWRFNNRIDGHFENLANLGAPQGDVWFDIVQYKTYTSELAAVRALKNDEVDLILMPNGISGNSASRLDDDAAITLIRNISRNGRFLAFNHANPYLAEPALHHALACLIDPNAFPDELHNDIAPLPGFVLDGAWRAENITLPCGGLRGNDRLKQALTILKNVGYSWRIEPVPSSAGSVFTDPHGNPLPTFTLLVSNEDPVRLQMANHIARQVEILGLSLNVLQSDPDGLLYAVYGSGNYDIALLGWSLSIYPDYLCEWFSPPGQNSFFYSASDFRMECEALRTTNDLGKAKAHLYEIQSILIRDLPALPLYATIRTDAYRNLYYPFENILDGLSRLYGAPSYAIPKK